MTYDILIYNDNKTSAQNLRRELRRSFPAAAFNIRDISIEDIRGQILRDPQVQMLVCPGSLHEDSDYQKNFRHHELDEYHDFLANGGVSLNICSGAYFATEIISYVPPSGNSISYRSLRPLFNGRALGPLYPYAMKQDPDSGLIQPSLAPVSFRNENGEWDETCLSYANGPAFFPDNPDDPAIGVLMTYSGMNQNPVAGLRLQIGKGSAYLIGPHPENGPVQLNDNGSPRLAALRNFNELMKPHEEGRRKFWSMLTRRIRQDLNLAA